MKTRKMSTPHASLSLINSNVPTVDPQQGVPLTEKAMEALLDRMNPSTPEEHVASSFISEAACMRL